MEHHAALALAAVTLALPGPTNTLLAVSGATSGWQRSVRLVPMAMLGYAIAVAALLTAVMPIVAAVPALETLLRIAVAAVLVHAALDLWRRPNAGQAAAAPSAVTAWHVLLTTLLNPKALILAAGLMPAVSLGLPSAFAARALELMALIAATGLAWVAIGAGFGSQLVRSASTAGSRRIERGGAIILVAFAAAVTTA